MAKYRLEGLCYVELLVKTNKIKFIKGKLINRVVLANSNSL